MTPEEKGKVQSAKRMQILGSVVMIVGVIIGAKNLAMGGGSGLLGIIGATFFFGGAIILLLGKYREWYYRD